MTNRADPVDHDEQDGASELLHRLAAAFDTLPGLTRAVFMLHRLDDLPYDEIAWRCGISVDEVTLRMADALTGIRRSCNGNPTLSSRARRALLPWSFAWARWRRERQDRQLGL